MVPNIAIGGASITMWSGISLETLRNARRLYKFIIHFVGDNARPHFVRHNFGVAKTRQY